MKDTDSKNQHLSEFADGRDENNLAEFPIALLGDSVPKGQKTIEFEDTLQDWSTGRTILRRVCITGSDKFGLPTAKDEQVLMGLIQLTRIANDFTSPEVWFVKRDVIEILGWEDRGWAYDRVEESLHRWKGVSIHYWNAWRDHENGLWRDSSAAGVIEYFSLTDGRFRGRRGDAAAEQAGRSCFCWNKLFFQSFQSGYLKKLDFSVYRSLKGAAAKRAYRFLDKRFYHKDQWHFDLRQFACEKLGFSKGYTTGQLKERVRPLLGELEEVGFIDPPELKKERPKVWTLSLTKRWSPMTTVCKIEPLESTESRNALTQRGVKPAVAKKLTEQFSHEHVMTKVGLVDWLVARDDRRISKSAAGFLVECIRKDYPLPDDYQRHLRSGKNCQNAGPPVPREVPVEVELVATDHRDSIDELLDSLSNVDREHLLAQAIAAATELERSSFDRVRRRGSQLYVALERNLLRKHIQLTNGVAPTAQADVE